MKKLNITISIMIMIVMALMAGSVLAAENAEKENNPEKTLLRRMRGPGMQQGCMMRRGMGGGMMGRGRGGRGRKTDRIIAILRVADELELSETQRDELSQIATDHKKDTIRQKAEIDLVRVDLQKLMKQDEPDIDEVRGKLMEIATLEVDMKCQQIQTRINTRNVLTEEQQETLKKILKNKPAQGIRGRYRSGRPGPRWQRGGPRK